MIDYDFLNGLRAMILGRDGWYGFLFTGLTFTQFRFFVFAALTALLYYLIPKPRRWIVLLAASLLFYLSWGPEKLPFLLFSCLTAWLAARRMASIQEKAETPAEGKRRCRPVLIAAECVLLGLMLYMKAGTWVIRSVGALLRLEGADTMSVITALGVSYYTFSLIAYLADVYWRKERAERNFFRLLLFTSYFPKVLQGPISRHQHLDPQLREPATVDYRTFCFGLQLMLWGFFKKLVIADRIAVLVNTIYESPEKYGGSLFLLGGMLAAIQLYGDFSGCMDIASGFSQCLGITLEKNFDRPFFSKSAAEFWRRWHITLGAWFRDYVYMPLMISPRLIGLSKRVRDRGHVRAGKAVMVFVPLMVTWILTGLWHNGDMTYLIWGLYWGTLICCSMVFQPECRKLAALLGIRTDTASWNSFRTVRTFFLFSLSRMLTSSASPGAAWEGFRRIWTDFRFYALVDGTLYSLGLDRADFLVGIAAVGVLWLVERREGQGSVREQVAGYNWLFRWAIYYLLFFAVLVFGMYGPGFNASAFAYMQF